MPSAQARVRTDRATRYLTQLCGHAAQLGARHHSHRHGEGATMPRRTECSGTDGVIEFDGGRCVLRATGEELVLVVEAEDEQRLRLVRNTIAVRVETIGRRDRLSLTWLPTPEAPDQPGR